MGKKSLLNNLFSKSKSDEDSESDLDALYCLALLADAHLGNNARLDAQINRFQKMLKLGSPAEEVIEQIDAIRKLINDKGQTVSASAAPVAALNTSLLKKLPATTFIQALLDEPLDASLKVQFNHYLHGLDDSLSTSEILGDVINLLKPESESELEIFDTQQESAPPSEYNKDEIQAIKKPIIKLLSSIEDDSNLAATAHSLITMSESVSDYDSLCRLLEDTSQLVLSSMHSATGQFEHFLLSLKERLEQVDSFVTQQGTTNKALADCGDKLSVSMNEQVGELRTSMSDSGSLEELENHVSKSIEFILSDLENFNSRRETLHDDAKQHIQDLESQLTAAKNETETLRDNLQQQRQRAMTDPLTHLPNRQSYDERLQMEYHRWQRYNKPLSLVMADLDHFKKINDTHGHTCGDDVLKQIADILIRELRETDFVARFGGEEFVILLPETNVKDAVIAMNKLRAKIQNADMVFEEHNFNVTMSFGVAAFEKKDDYNLVFNRADTALYRAKSRGRNQVCAELKKAV